MARRRPARPAKIKKNNRPKTYYCEALEERLQFVVLHGGDVFEFFADGLFYERVVVEGNTTVELVGGRVNPTTGAFSINGMDGVITSGPDAGIVGTGFVNPTGATIIPVDTIFAMDVVQSDSTSRIAVAEVPVLTVTPRPMEPYLGTNTLQVIPTASSDPTTATVFVTPGGPVSSGAAILGALTVKPTDDTSNDHPQEIPILTATVTAGEFTYVPAGTLSAGLQIAGSFGSFLFGGTVTGTVAIHGSINQFYAGWLVTGNTTGEQDVGIISDPQNFLVDGDLRDLITDAAIGTNSFSPLNYSSGFDLYVGGRVGQINTQDSLLGDVTVANSNPITAIAAGTPETEVENRGPANYDPWDNAMLGSAPGEPATFLYNDSFATAQYLGLTDPAGNITVDGELQADKPTQDLVDYYAVPLMAGQTVTTQLVETATDTGTTTSTGAVTSGDLDLGVFDPDDRLIASDYNHVDPSQTEEEPFQFTASEPGVYRFAVAETGNPNFQASGGNVILFADFPYQLTIKNVGNLAIGGIVAATNIEDNPDVNGLTITGGTGVGGTIGTTSNTTAIDGFHVENGDFGAAVAGGAVLPGSDDFTPFMVYSFAVDNGNLRTVEGGNIGGVGTVVSGTLSASAAVAVAGGMRTPITSSQNTGSTVGNGPSVSVPNGSVGLLESTTAAAGGILDWNVFTDTETTLTPAESAQYAIGGDYEMVSSQSIFAGDLIADGNIGTIRAGTMATDPASYLQVNADNNPNVHGVIDLIDVQTFLGDLADGGPAIVTGQGGNVRYITLGPYGVAYNDIFFGGGSPSVTLYQPGEVVTLTDDSGSLVTLTPVGGTLATTSTSTTSTSTTSTSTSTVPNQPVYSPAASLYVTTYPIRGSGGAAIIEVESTDSLALSASGQTAEIGTIVLDGTGTGVVAGTTTTTTTTTTSSSSSSSSTSTSTSTNPSQGNGTTSIGGQGNTTTVPPPAAGQPGGPPIESTVPGGASYKTQTVPPVPIFDPTVTFNPLTLTYSGSAKIDTYEITGPPADPDGSLMTGVGQATSITNSTGGEIVNLNLTSLGSLTTSGSVGAAVEHNTAAAVQGLIVDPNLPYPFLDPRSMVYVVGDIINITAGQGIDNVYAGVLNGSAFSSGASGSVVPQPGGTPAVGSAGNAISGGTDGEIGSIVGHITGPIVAAGFVGSATLTGGVGSAGSGAIGSPGIYSVGIIGPVTSSGDFHGNIVSTTAMISLNVNGTIDEADIDVSTEFDTAEQRNGSAFLPIAGNNPITFPIVNIGNITVGGNGGIIGTRILADHIGLISVATSCFGIFDSVIDTAGEGTLAGISVGGYGLRDGLFYGGASVGAITVHGNGSNSPVTNYSTTVRQSETGAQFDAATGSPLTFLNDIDQYLGTTASTPSIAGVTDTGVIEDFTALGSRTLGSVTAYSIRGRDLSTLISTVDGFTPAINPDVTTFNVADAINNITVAGPIAGFDLTTGRTSRYSFGGDVSGLDMTVAGPINALVLRSNLDDDSSINAIGPSGHIVSLTIDGNLAGSVTSTRYIQNLHVLGSITGTVQAARIGTVHIQGPVGNQGLTINGALTSLIVDGTFGPPGTPITVNGNAGTIRIHGDLNTNISVTGKLTQLIVGGSILTGSTTTIGSTLNLLQVAEDVQAGATVHAMLIRRRLVKGQVLGNIIAP